ncbi:hypothetical protein UZ36_02585 [Candidatus Nitromaritima sp. SCGC AAA799-C22]|nr:hypothetical protein UZ36_02585 [Candidatus Nitromaritima sp. SCGC AAA799-C22]
MEIDPEMLEKIMVQNVEFKTLYEEHTQLKSKVEELNKSKFLTPEQEMEKKKHQKQKLVLKDKMEEILSQSQVNLH